MIGWNPVDLDGASSTDDEAAARRSKEQVRRRAARKAEQFHAQQNTIAARALSTTLRQDGLLHAERQATVLAQAALSMPAPTPMPMPTSIPKPPPPPAPMPVPRQPTRAADDAIDGATSPDASETRALQQPSAMLSQALTDVRALLESIDSASGLEMEAAAREMQDWSWHERAQAGLDFIEAFHAETLDEPAEKSRLLAALADSRALLRKMLAKGADGELSAVLASGAWVQQLAIESRRAGDTLPVLTLRAV